MACSAHANLPASNIAVLTSLVKDQTTLTTFTTAKQATDHLNGGITPTLNGKLFIINYQTQLFTTQNQEIDDPEQISNFQASVEPNQPETVEVKFELTTPQKSTNSYQFQITGFQPLIGDTKQALFELNQLIEQHQLYLADPQHVDPIISNDGSFYNISSTNVLANLMNIKWIPHLRYEVLNFTNQNRIVKFKIKIISNTEVQITNELTFWSPTKMFELMLATTPLIAPPFQINIPAGQAVKLGTQPINLENQKKAIQAFLTQRWFNGNNNRITLDNPTKIYRFALSAGTNADFARIFGANWTDWFKDHGASAPNLGWQNIATDFNNIKQLTVGFQLKLLKINTAQNQTATYQFIPLFMQFNWDKNKRPVWLMASEGSFRLKLTNQQLVSIVVKNDTTGKPGDLVSI